MKKSSLLLLIFINSFIHSMSSDSPEYLVTIDDDFDPPLGYFQKKLPLDLMRIFFGGVEINQWSDPEQMPYLEFQDLLTESQKEAFNNREQLLNFWKQFYCFKAASIALLTTLFCAHSYKGTNKLLGKIKLYIEKFKKHHPELAPMSPHAAVAYLAGLAIYPLVTFWDLFALGLPSKIKTTHLNSPPHTVFQERKYSHSTHSGNTRTHHYVPGDPIGFTRTNPLKEALAQCKKIQPFKWVTWGTSAVIIWLVSIYIGEQNKKAQLEKEKISLST